MGPIASLADILDMVRRRARLIAGLVMLGFAASLVLGLGQRPVFESREVLQIAPPRVAHDLAPTTVSDPLARRLPHLRQHLLGGAVLGEIVGAYRLFADDPQRTQAARVHLLRQAVAVDWDGGLSAPTEIIIRARMEVPEQARLVAQELAHRMINASVRMRIAEARTTLDFLRKSETAVQGELAALTARIATDQRARTLAAADLADAPTDIAEPQVFERELDRLTVALSDATARRVRGETGLDLETRRQSERLIVVEPAERPIQPVTDIRGIVVALGGGLSAVLAFLAALALELRHPVIRTGAQMQRMTGITPIATIPRVNMQPARRPSGMIGRFWRNWGAARAGMRGE